MGKIKSYKDLIVWQKAMDLSVMVYDLTKTFPESEKFGLIPQIQRSVVSVASNIAEGWGRKSKGDYVRFLKISRGSLFELETQLLLVEKIFSSNLNDTTVFGLIEEIGKMINGLIKSLENVE